MLKFYANGNDINNTYDNTCEAIKFVQTCGDLKVLYKFHDYLQIVVSHHTLDEENSESVKVHPNAAGARKSNGQQSIGHSKETHNKDSFGFHVCEICNDFSETSITHRKDVSLSKIFIIPIIKHISIHSTPLSNIEYILNGDKNNEMKFATGINCTANPQNAYDEFRITRDFLNRI